VVTIDNRKKRTGGLQMGLDESGIEFTESMVVYVRAWGSTNSFTPKHWPTDVNPSKNQVQIWNIY